MFEVLPSFVPLYDWPLQPADQKYVLIPSLTFIPVSGLSSSCSYILWAIEHHQGWG